MRRFLLPLLLLSASASAPRAEVMLTFYSHHLGVYRNDVVFPHAHIAVKGTIGADHKPVKANFGFTAEETPPSILWEPVNGKIMSMPDDYIAASKPHLSITISDEQYRAVLAVVGRWKKNPQPSYRLDAHNCVTFVQDVALALKLPASPRHEVRARSGSVPGRLTSASCQHKSGAGSGAAAHTASPPGAAYKDRKSDELIFCTQRV